MKRFLLILTGVVLVLAAAITGGSFYMLSYSLSPDEQRADTAYCFRHLVDRHPEMQPWLDSLKSCGALRDTFVTMPTGERHHGYYVRGKEGAPIALVIHGWRNCAIDFMNIGRIYQQMGYHVLMPDLHAHGLSEGEAIGMGWYERKDVLHWMKTAAHTFGSGDFVVHGVSMGAATTMNVSGEQMPEEVKTIRFVEDCGYTSVWDEFSHELDADFGLPDIPLMYATSLLCKLKYGWSFGEASPLSQVAKCHYPMLFIHGDADDFVPSHMVYPLYEAKKGPKKLWITKGTTHAKSYSDYTEDYIQHVKTFVK